MFSQQRKRMLHTSHDSLESFQFAAKFGDVDAQLRNGLGSRKPFQPSAKNIQLLAGRVRILFHIGKTGLQGFVFGTSNKGLRQAVYPPSVDECGEYPEYRPPAVKLSQYVGHGSLHHYIR